MCVHNLRTFFLSSNLIYFHFQRFLCHLALHSPSSLSSLARYWHFLLSRQTHIDTFSKTAKQTFINITSHHQSVVSFSLFVRLKYGEKIFSSLVCAIFFIACDNTRRSENDSLFVDVCCNDNLIKKHSGDY